MRWALLWMFVAGGAFAAAVQETRVPPLEVASAEPAPREASPPIAVAEPRPLPPARGFGGVPSEATAEPARVTVEPTDIEILEEAEHDCVVDKVDRCPDQPEDYDGPEDVDGCPDPYPRTELRGGVEVTVNRHVIDGRNIITESSITIYK